MEEDAHLLLLYQREEKHMVAFTAMVFAALHQGEHGSQPAEF